MPFTLAHPAAAVPLVSRLGRYGCLSALAVGSLVPDLPYFLPLGVSGVQSHSLPGMLWFCLPAGVLAWVAYEVLLRPFLIALAPPAVVRRMAPRRPRGWSPAGFAPVAVSVLAGTATHVLWDSFTHRSGFVVRAVPALRASVHLFDGYDPAVFTLLQHVSTLVGMGVLSAWGLRWFRTARVDQTPETMPLSARSRGVLIATLLLPSAMVGMTVLWTRLDVSEATFRVFQDHLGRAILSAGTVFLGTLILTALVWRFWLSWPGERPG